MNIRKNMLIYFFGKLIPALANIVFMVAGMRLLGKAVYGEFNLQFSSVMIISSLGVGWLQQSVLRFLPGMKVDQSRGGYLYITLIVSLFVTIITCLFGFFYFQLTGFNLIVYGLFSWFFSLFSVQLTIVQASFQSTIYAAGESAYYLFTIVLLLAGILLLGMQSAFVYFIALLIALILVQAGFMIYPPSNRKLKTGNFPGKEQVMIYFRYGFPLTFWIMLANLYNLVDRFFIHHFDGYEHVGLYSSVYDLVFKASGFLSLPVLLSFHPAISKAWSDNDISKVKALIKKSMIWEACILLLMFSAMFLVLPILLDKLFAIRDEGVVQLFLPLAISAGLWQLVLLVQKPLELGSKRSAMIGGIICTLGLNAILNAILIPMYGYKIAAWTTLICTVLYFCLIWIAANFQLKRSAESLKL